MNDRETKVFVLHQLMLEGYSRKELAKMLRNLELFEELFTEKVIFDLLKDAKDSCKIDADDSALLYERIEYVYKGAVKKEDYGSALKAIKELKDFTKTDSGEQITVKFIKE